MDTQGIVDVIAQVGGNGALAIILWWTLRDLIQALKEKHGEAVIAIREVGEEVKEMRKDIANWRAGRA